MEVASPPGPSATTEAAAQAYRRLHQQAAAPLTSLAQAQALLAELLAHQQALLLENQHLRATQQELASSENRLKAAEAVAGMGSYELDIASGALHFSEGLYRLFGEEPGSFTPSRAWLGARSRPEDGAVVAQVLDQAIRDKQPYRYTHHIRRADGAWRTLESQGRVVCDAAGTAIRVEGVVADQTDRQQVEHALQTAEDPFQLFITASVDVVYKMSADWQQMYQLAGKEFLADTRTSTDSWLHGYIPAADQPAVVAAIAQATETKSFFEYEHRVFRADGTIGWVHSRAVPVCSPAGDLVEWVGTATDITARKEAEQARDQATERLQATLDSSLDMIQVFEAVRDEHGDIVDFRWTLNNQVSEKAFGDVIGQRLLARNPGVVEAGIFDTFKRVVETGVPDQSERHYTSEQFDGWFYQSAVKLRDGVAVTTTDISERKRHAQEILQLQQEIAQRAEDKYRTLFNAIDEGFCLFELLYDAQGTAVDYRFLEVNQVFEQQTGLANVPGKLGSDLAPSTEPHWLNTYAQVVQTGQPVRFESYHAGTGRWYEAYAVQLGGAGSRQVGTVFNDTTERKRHEQRQQFLLQLNDALRSLVDPLAIQRAAMRVVGEHFGLDRAMYAEITPDGETTIIADNYLSGRFPPFTGAFPLAAYGSIIHKLRDGEPLIVADIDAENELTEAEKTNYRQIGSTAFVTTPLLKDGRWVANFVVHQGHPRRWTMEEVALFRETAERTWAAVERARAEAALHESEERFRNLVEAYAQAVWETDPRGVVVQDSPSWRAYTGQTEAEWLGNGWTHAVHPDDRLYAERQWRAAVAAGHSVDTEFRLRCATGGYRWTNIRATPIRDAAGQVSKWAGMNIDIDPQKRASESLRRSKDRLRLAIEAAELATWDWDLTTNEVRWNERHFTLFGMAPSPDPVTPADFERHVHPDDRATVIQLLQAAAAERTLFQAEFRAVTDQGDVRWMSGHGQPTSTAPDGRVLWMSGVMLDITDRKRTEQQQQELAAALERKVARRTQALQASQDLQEAVFNTVRHAITVFTAVRDAQGQIIDFAFLLSNGVADRHLGLATAGKTLSTVLPGYVDEDNFRRMVQVVETGQPTDAVLHVAFGDHPIHLHTQYNKLRDGVVLVHEDITERLQAERAIQDSRDLLQSVYDTSLVGMAVLHAVRDASGTIEDFTFVSVNQELARATGRPDLVGRRYAQEFPGSVPSGSLALMARAVETGEPQQHEYFYPYENVNRWYASMYVQLDGGVVATTLDITERKQAEQELRNNLGLLEQSEQVAQLGSWEYELATGTLRWSAGMYRLFDLPPGAPVQPAIYLDYVVAADRPVAERVVRALTDTPADLTETLRLHVGGEEKTVRLKAVVQRDGAGQPARVLGVDLDSSQVQRLEADNLRLRLRQQQALFEAVQAAEEAERRRVSESLHNGIGQLLYATKLQLDRLPTAPEAGPRQEAARLLGEAIRQTRALSHELTPALLEEFGLEKTLQSICSTLNTPALRWHCYLMLEEAAALPLPLQLAVYRLAQELAQNVLKHAQATEATLEVELLPGWLVLRVEDNGRGFDATHTSDGLGLRSLRSRVALLGGQVHLATAPQEGTQFQLRIPLAP